MSSEGFYWAATVICMTGTVVNVWRINACFVLWFVGEVMWTCIDLENGVHSRVLLDVMGASLAALGIWKNIWLRRFK